MLSEQLLTILRDYWRRAKPPESCLFPGQNHKRPITCRSVQRACCEAADAAGLDKSVTVHTRIAYSSCRNRHCPKCQWSAAQTWLEAREAELLPVPYFHIVFTLAAVIGAAFAEPRAAPVSFTHVGPPQSRVLQHEA